MPTVIIPNIPGSLYERLCVRANDESRTVAEELLSLASLALQPLLTSMPVSRQPDFTPGDEVIAPYDLPRTSSPTSVVVRAGQPRVPDFVAGFDGEQP